MATTVSKKRNDLLAKLGADEIIDYHTQKIEDVLSDYDIVLDTLGAAVHEASYKILKKGGTLVSVLGIPDNETIAEFSSSFIVKLIAWRHNRKMNKQAARSGANYRHHLMYSDGGQLAEIAESIEAGKIRAVIDSTFPLDQLRAAFERSMTGRAQGKIVISID